MRKNILLSIISLFILFMGGFMAVELYTHPLYSDANLLNYYRMEGNPNDSKGTVHGTNYNMSYGTSYGKFGEGATFNGSTSRILLTNTFNFNSSDFTVNAWINKDTLTSAHAIVAKHDTSAAAGGWIMLVNNQRFQAWEYTSAGAFNGKVPASDNITSTGTWYMCTYVHDHGANTRLYVNGQNVYDNTATTISGSTTLKARIGNLPNVTDANVGAYPFDGNIDDVSVFSRALTGDEILAYYNFSRDGGSPIFFGNTAIA